MLMSLNVSAQGFLPSHSMYLPQIMSSIIINISITSLLYICIHTCTYIHTHTQKHPLQGLLHSVNKYSNFYDPGTILNVGDTMMNEKKKSLAIVQITFQLREATTKISKIEALKT